MNDPRVRLSWFFLIGGALAGAELVRQGRWPGSPLIVIPSCGYAAWSLYWGFPVFGDWFRRSERLFRLVHFRGGEPWLALGFLVARVLVVFMGCVYYSLLGGGIFRFCRAWRGHRAA